MHKCAKGIEFASFLHFFSVEFWNCFDSVVLFLHFMTDLNVIISYVFLHFQHQV